MLTIRNQGRGAGKTTTAIKLLEENWDAFLLVPYRHMIKNYYPEDLRTRIYTPNEILNGFMSQRKYRKAILDDCFLCDPVTLAKLHYYLGYNNLETISFATINE
ncbi:hypothetical protein IEN91_05135 [Bacillus velezensis]|uniref:hypothetical protein n=1 Tax=Bacillus velezensis TaxID=492670 RepID=UPI0018C6D9A9|nr:hypothetical protein [Bacillus velezensis]QPK89823.1 hypothetical protein IEN91_05135 [Bacillus velezensis]